MTDYKVHKSPLPERVTTEKKTAYPFKEMALGDWLYIEGMLNAERVQNSGHAYGKKTKTGFKLSRRKDPEAEESYFLVRVK